MGSPFEFLIDPRTITPYRISPRTVPDFFARASFWQTMETSQRITSHNCFMVDQSLDPRPKTGTFEHFVEENYQAGYRFAFSLCGNHHDACDITQQAFYLAHTRSDQLRDVSKRKQWLFTILYREFLRTRRRETNHPQVNLEFSEAELPHISVDHASSLDSKTVLVALQTLDESFRMPLTLFYLDQLSYKEIAAALELPIGTVMSRLARGKNMLRQKLEEKRTGDLAKIIPLPKAHEGGMNG